MNGRRMEGGGLACVTTMSIGITVVEVEVFTRSVIQQQLASEPAMPAAVDSLAE